MKINIRRIMELADKYANEKQEGMESNNEYRIIEARKELLKYLQEVNKNNP